MIDHSDFDLEQSEEGKIQFFSTISDDFAVEIEQYWLKAEHEGQSFGDMTTEYVQWQLILNYPDSFKLAYMNDQFKKDLSQREKETSMACVEHGEIESA